MSRLSRHLRVLLQRYPEIAVKGLGTFVCEYEPAFYDELTGTIRPYSRNYYFREKVEGNPALLIDSYKRRGGVSAAVAEREVESDVRDVKECVRKYGKCHLDGLGTIYAKDSGYAFYFDREFKASDPYSLLPVLMAGFATRNEEKVGEESVRRSFERNDDYYYIRISKKVARIAASFLLVVIVGICALMIVPAGGIDSPHAASIVPVETALPKKVVNTESTLQSEKEAAQKMESILPAPDPEDKYFLIVGAFRSTKECEVFMERYEDSGFELLLIEGKKINLIATASAQESDSMKEKTKDTQVLETFGQTWVWKKP